MSTRTVQTLQIDRGQTGLPLMVGAIIPGSVLHMEVAVVGRCRVTLRRGDRGRIAKRIWIIGPTTVTSNGLGIW